jgi:hypothetical protein
MALESMQGDFDASPWQRELLALCQSLTRKLEAELLPTRHFDHEDDLIKFIRDKITHDGRKKINWGYKRPEQTSTKTTIAQERRAIARITAAMLTDGGLATVGSSEAPDEEIVNRQDRASCDDTTKQVNYGTRSNSIVGDELLPDSQPEQDQPAASTEGPANFLEVNSGSENGQETFPDNAAETGAADVSPNREGAVLPINHIQPLSPPTRGVQIDSARVGVPPANEISPHPSATKPARADVADKETSSHPVVDRSVTSPNAHTEHTHKRKWSEIDGESRQVSPETKPSAIIEQCLNPDPPHLSPVASTNREAGAQCSRSHSIGETPGVMHRLAVLRLLIWQATHKLIERVQQRQKTGVVTDVNREGKIAMEITQLVARVLRYKFGVLGFIMKVAAASNSRVKRLSRGSR